MSNAPAKTSPEAMRNALISLIKERSFQSGPEIKLASGRSSSFYFNMKPTMLHPAGARLIAALMLDRLSDTEIDGVGGLEMGAVPLAASLAAVSEIAGRPLPAFFVRKTAKAHGTQSLIEGFPAGDSISGRKVAILEDVTTTGGSALKAADVVRDAGGIVVCVLTVVDREEGAQSAFAAAGVDFRPLLRAADFA